jgi:hypothetical protein
MDHQQLVVGQCDRHHFESFLVTSVAQEHKPWLARNGRAGWRRLLETKAAVIDDVADAPLADSVFGR